MEDGTAGIFSEGLIADALRYPVGMRWRLNQWVLSLGMVALCAVAAGVIWRIRCAPVHIASLAGYLPDDTSIIISMNVEALRSRGVLETLVGQPGTEEPDYRLFVDMTGFDYRRDLDHVLLGFRGDTTYVLASGRYDWDAMRRYAQQAGGTCNNSYCQMLASEGGRHISFLPIRGGAIALASGPSQWAAWDLSPERSPDLPEDWVKQPVLISVSQDTILNGERAPEGLRPWLRLLNGAQRLVVTVSADGVAGWQMQMRVRCERPADSERIETQLAAATTQLRNGSSGFGKLSTPGSLASLLAGGTFSRTGTEVEGRWPVNMEFLEMLAGGKL